MHNYHALYSYIQYLAVYLHTLKTNVTSQCTLHLFIIYFYEKRFDYFALFYYLTFIIFLNIFYQKTYPYNFLYATIKEHFYLII